uniref:Uncharacterized protein n=1 Tax=Rhizophora mucronata TaxID=61149 RepID=A0A2P2QYT7_RHIMU
MGPASSQMGSSKYCQLIILFGVEGRPSPCHNFCTWLPHGEVFLFLALAVNLKDILF